MAPSPNIKTDPAKPITTCDRLIAAAFMVFVRDGVKASCWQQ
jgi:hypothetical protein